MSPDASTEEIKQAYRKKATEYHPDVSGDPDAEEKNAAGDEEYVDADFEDVEEDDEA